MPPPPPAPSPRPRPAQKATGSATARATASSAAAARHALRQRNACATHGSRGGDPPRQDRTGRTTTTLPPPAPTDGERGAQAAPGTSFWACDMCIFELLRVKQGVQERPQNPKEYLTPPPPPPSGTSAHAAWDHPPTARRTTRRVASHRCGRRRVRTRDLRAGGARGLRPSSRRWSRGCTPRRVSQDPDLRSRAPVSPAAPRRRGAPSPATALVLPRLTPTKSVRSAVGSPWQVCAPVRLPTCTTFALTNVFFCGSGIAPHSKPSPGRHHGPSALVAVFVAQPTFRVHATHAHPTTYVAMHIQCLAVHITRARSRVRQPCT